MTENSKLYCPDCDDPKWTLHEEALHRREFFHTLGAGAAKALAVGAVASAVPQVLADAPAAPAAPRTPKPAEALIQELYASLDAEQRRTLVHPWDHADRTRIFNRAISRNIGQAYNRQQQELVGRIFRAICSDDEGYRRLSRDGGFDSSGSLQGCGANIFGDPTNGRQFAWVFTGHHLTVRCDGNTEPNTVFGGPMYYGHSAPGYSERNQFFFQTQSVQEVFDALSEEQRRQAVVGGNPGEGVNSVRLRGANDALPGLASGQLTADQRTLVQRVMRNLLSLYRREDADEVMEIVRRNGGLERIHLAFYREAQQNDNNRWHFWRLEGPGFVWNYRVLPHVHCYVNIAAQA